MKTLLSVLAVAGFALAGSVLTSASSPAAPTGSAPRAPAPTYEIDPVHSTVLFRCLHVGTSWSYGRFTDLSGSFVLDEENPAASKVSVKIQTASVDTANKQRDDHLRGPDFFDVKQFPEATFESTKVARSDAKTWRVEGRLSLHGVTKDVTLDMEHVGSVDDKRMGKRTGFHGTLAISRSAYGVKYSPEGLGDEVTLTLSVEAVQK